MSRRALKALYAELDGKDRCLWRWRRGPVHPPGQALNTRSGCPETGGCGQTHAPVRWAWAEAHPRAARLRPGRGRNSGGMPRFKQAFVPVAVDRVPWRKPWRRFSTGSSSAT